MPYNPAAYASYLERAGYYKAKDLLAWDIDTSMPLGERVARVGQRLAARQRIRVRPVDMSRRGFAADLEHLKTIYRAAWTDNWGFVPPTDAEIRHLAFELKPVVDPDLVLFAEVDGRVVGCAVALPDLNQVLKRMHGRLLPLGLWHFLRRRSIVTRARACYCSACCPTYRKRGLYPLLIRGAPPPWLRARLQTGRVVMDARGQRARQRRHRGGRWTTAQDIPPV